MKSQNSLDANKVKFIKDAILGESYELSLVFITSAKIRALNRIYRKKDKATDILSFPLSKTSGEIFICLSETKKEAPKFDLTFDDFLIFLFIHGLLHLKGMDHGATMERKEKYFLKQFLNGSNNSNRNRHRNLRSESSGGRGGQRKGRKDRS
jgi:probable rRNA maturation factor